MRVDLTKDTDLAKVFTLKDGFFTNPRAASLVYPLLSLLSSPLYPVPPLVLPPIQTSSRL